MKIVVTGGGTGGHIYPMATIALYMKETYGAEILYIGSNQDLFPDKRLAAYFNLSFEGIPSRGMEGGKPIDFAWQNVKGVWKARKILQNFKPDIVFSTGGFVSFPVVTAASQLGIPYVLHEQNTVVGKVNRLAEKKARKVLHTFPITHKENTIVTGNPVRYKNPIETEGDKVVILGGSGGSLALNEAGIALAKKNPSIPFLIQTGKELYKKAQQEAGDTPNLTLIPYCDDLMDVYKQAKCVITRSGSGSIFELANVGIPSIFVPLPNSAEDHQKKNALFFTQEKAAIMVEQGEAFQENLEKQLLELWGNDTLRQDIKQRLDTLAVRDSEARIAKELCTLLPKNV